MTRLLSQDGRILWRAYPAAPLDALGAFDPETQAAAPVKRNLARSVLPCRLGGIPAYLKIHRSRSLWDRLKQRVAPKAFLEADLARRLRARGIPAPEPLAAGRGALASFLITRGIPGAEPLHEAGARRFPGLAPAERRLWSGRLGGLLAALHRAHLWHPDLHAGNLLVSEAPDGGPWITVADLPSARLVTSIPPRLALRSLAMLAASLPFMSRGGQMRALRAYWGREEGGTLPPRDVLRRQVAAILRERDRIWEVHWRSRTRRCVRTTGAFVSRREGGLDVVARRELPEGAAGEALALHRQALDAAATTGDPRVVKRDRWTAVTRGIRAGGFRLCVKAFRERGYLDGLRRDLGYGRAKRAWIAANALAERGCATARPLAWIEADDGGCLVTEDLSARGHELDRLLARHWAGMPQAERRRLIGDLARAFRRLADRGAWPGDAKACNLFARPLPEGGWEFALVDVDGVRQMKPGPGALAKALAQLHLSTPRALGRLSRGRFLRAFLGPGGRRDWRPLARRILARAGGQRLLYQTDAGDVSEDQP